MLNPRKAGASSAVQATTSNKKRPLQHETTEEEEEEEDNAVVTRHDSANRSRRRHGGSGGSARAAVPSEEKRKSRKRKEARNREKEEQENQMVVPERAEVPTDVPERLSPYRRSGGNQQLVTVNMDDLGDLLSKAPKAVYFARKSEPVAKRTAEGKGGTKQRDDGGKEQQEERSKCPHCGKTFKRSTNLDLHIERVSHIGSVQSLLCLCCNASINLCPH